MESKAKILMLKGEKGDPGGAEWGNISGSLSNQTDLKNELDNKANSEDIGPAALTNDYNDLNNKPNLATVATSGSYTDLTNTPTQLTDFSGVLPVSQGGTGAADGAIPRRFTLFSSVEGVEPTTLTLSDTILNYQKIGVTSSNPEVSNDIEYDYSEFCILPGITSYAHSVRVIRTGGTAEHEPGIIVHTMRMIFSGSTASYTNALKVSLTESYTDVWPQKLKIHYIFGYKY